MTYLLAVVFAFVAVALLIAVDHISEKMRWRK